MMWCLGVMRREDFGKEIGSVGSDAVERQDGIKAIEYRW